MDQHVMSRRQLLQALGSAGVAAPFAAAFGSSTALRAGRAAGTASARGRCPLDMETATKAITPVFARTGWRTMALDHITFRVADRKKEAAFYVALMGWKLRSDDTQAVMDVGDWGTVVFKQGAPTLPGCGGGAATGRRRTRRWRGAAVATVEGFGFDIEPWNAKTVEAELRKRGLTPVADNDGKGFESFHVKDPDGFDLQIGNGNGHASAQARAPATRSCRRPAPFESTGWKTVWLDHLSFGVNELQGECVVLHQPARLEADLR